MRNPDFFTGRLGNRMFQIAYLYSQVKKGEIPDWYLQDTKYFEEYAEEIKQLFGEGIGYLTQVGIHIRRGTNPANPLEPEYSKNPFYVDLCKSEYYKKAMAIFPNENFLIFSDDPEWCKERFQGPNIQVMDKGDAVEDLNLFASCKSQIIANSSWSWWGAYLNPSPNKQVIAPSQWYADGIQRTAIPNTWIQI